VADEHACGAAGTGLHTGVCTRPPLSCSISSEQVAGGRLRTMLFGHHLSRIPSRHAVTGGRCLTGGEAGGGTPAENEEAWEDAVRVDKLKALAMEWERTGSHEGLAWRVDPVRVLAVSQSIWPPRIGEPEFFSGPKLSNLCRSPSVPT
jgi:hypothetical protein